MHVCLVIPADTVAVSEVMAAVWRHHPEATFGAVWAGDPHLRPRAPERAEWIDLDLSEPSGVGWSRLLVALAPEAYQLARGSRSLAGSHLDGPALLLRVGAVGVAGALDGLLPDDGIALIERTSGSPAVDGFAPTGGDLVASGRFGFAAIGFGADATSVAGDIADALTTCAAGAAPGGLFGGVIERSGCQVSMVTDGHVLGWNEPPSGFVSVIDVDHLDRDEPWHVSFEGREARVKLADEPSLAALVESTRPQWNEALDTLRLPGGFEVDTAVRNLVAAAVEAWRRGEGELPPEPFGGNGSALVEWLETPWPPWGPDIGRYWTEVRRLRPDLVGAFAHPAGADHDAFVDWATNSWRFDGRSPLWRTGAHAMRPTWQSAGFESGGINLVGYLGFDKSLGDVARRIHRSLKAAGLPVAALHYHRSGSPTSVETPELTDRVTYDTNLIVINADQIDLVHADYGSVLFEGRYTVAYWFWELAYVPPAMVDAMELVDEVWVATDFTADAFRAVTDRPVRTVPIPVPAPEPSAATRAELGVPDGRFVFLVTLDHLSVTERKNPVAAVEAYLRAFPEPSDDGPVLMVKTLNREHRWAEHERIRLVAAGRPDVLVVDRHLSRPDQMALTATADCLVSLHRAEGLGLHLMEAMWLGTPTIATRYSGNLHFMDDDNSALVDAVLVDVEHGEQYFPSEAQWAEPDLDQAATWMRRMVAEPELVGRLAAAGRARMQEQPDLAETGRTIAELSRLTRDESARDDDLGGRT